MTKAERLALLSIKRQFDIFMHEEHKEAYLATSIMRLSLEKHNRTLMRKIRPCVDIMKIGINIENRSKGLCRDILHYIEEYCLENEKVTYVENVLSVRLKSMLKKRGYKKRYASFYLLPKESIKSIKS